MLGTQHQYKVLRHDVRRDRGPSRGLQEGGPGHVKLKEPVRIHMLVEEGRERAAVLVTELGFQEQLPENFR